MKISMNQVIVNIRKMQHPQKGNIRMLFVLFSIFLWSCTTTSVAQRAEVSFNINLPSWAPYYDNIDQVNYYYLPDIECYYDVRSREFIYMEDGEWMFGRSLPPIYAWFDLNNSFIVALNARVVEPWRHFHYYVAHYPRFYYRTVYRDRYMDHNHPLRGFNENARDVVYNHRSEREDNSFNRRDDSRREENNRFENRPNNEVKRNFPERRVEPTHPAEPMKYYGREVGRPVRVQRNMKRVEETKERPANKQAKPERQDKQEKQSRQR